MYFAIFLSVKSTRCLSNYKNMSKHEHGNCKAGEMKFNTGQNSIHGKLSGTMKPSKWSAVRV